MPSHYLNQRWPIVNWIHGNSFQWNLNKTKVSFIQEIQFHLQSGPHFLRSMFYPFAAFSFGCVYLQYTPHLDHVGPESNGVCVASKLASFTRNSHAPALRLLPFYRWIFYLFTDLLGSFPCCESTDACAEWRGVACSPVGGDWQAVAVTHRRELTGVRDSQSPGKVT